MKKKILVVEDEIIIAHDIKGILQGEYEVVANIKTVEEAINCLEQEQFDLVLLDINLKADKDGTDLGKFLLNNDSIPFVYVTSHSDQVTLDKVKDTRPYGFLIKPFRSVDLLSIVFLALNNFKHRNVDILRSNTEIIDDIPFRIKNTINYIDDHISEKIELSALAAITSWKEHHFIRVFTKLMGVTPYQYILTRKIEKAKMLLIDDDLPITSISFELGFQSHSNFINAFKKLTNTTPEAFRNLARLKKQNLK
jgi:AraC-like DNA-binding protein